MMNNRQPASVPSSPCYCLPRVLYTHSKRKSRVRNCEEGAIAKQKVFIHSHDACDHHHTSSSLILGIVDHILKATYSLSQMPRSSTYTNGLTHGLGVHTIINNQSKVSYIILISSMYDFAGNKVFRPSLSALPIAP